jgi:hypothetical protein
VVSGHDQPAARINARDVSYALEHPEGPFSTTVDLPAGSLVVEKYHYETERRTTGVQWLAQSVDAEGNLLLHRACRTRKEALEALSRV